ncbi:hypothetical protein PG985_002745 [Apiospora marii]|uniref:uncharacterized protein n=1 Tax=Apiospora marii TaxID=335849 RepID=UPI00312E3DE9
MEQDFYVARLRDKFGLTVVVPDEAGRGVVHGIIYQELCNGIVQEPSCETYYRVIASLKSAGVECLILGCTEIGLLLDEKEVEERCGLPLFDTTKIHAVAAVDWAMEAGDQDRDREADVSNTKTKCA